jgi:2-polyprenyl-3-methyl-5-hydroxy-6-metoxy-1,4-benzoquinol methylase
MSAGLATDRGRRCRFCNNELHCTFADLGMSPLANSYIAPECLQRMEPFYPLHAFVCEKCYLVQLEELESPEKLFGDYPYFSSYSESWLRHAQSYAKQMVDRFRLGRESLVVEVASNDGYLLQYFKAAGIHVLGIEPARNVAEAAEKMGIPTMVKFFGTAVATALAESGHRADLLVGNNVLAHVPELNDFVAGLQILLKPNGLITMEFPHLFRLIEGNQFDTIYHEHFSYFSFTTAEKVFASHGLVLFDVQELPTHGGSLRIFAKHKADESKPIAASVSELREREESAGITRMATYRSFAKKIKETKRRLLEFLIDARRSGKRIVGYGAPAKGNTLLNYCGVKTDFLEYTVDRSPHKQGCYLPGTRIPVYSPERITETRPDYVLILPWNLKDEIIEQMSYIRRWGGRFVVPIPEPKVLE